MLLILFALALVALGVAGLFLLWNNRRNKPNNLSAKVVPPPLTIAGLGPVEGEQAIQTQDSSPSRVFQISPVAVEPVIQKQDPSPCSMVLSSNPHQLESESTTETLVQINTNDGNETRPVRRFSDPVSSQEQRPKQPSHRNVHHASDDASRTKHVYTAHGNTEFDMEYKVGRCKYCGSPSIPGADVCYSCGG